MICGINVALIPASVSVAGVVSICILMTIAEFIIDAVVALIVRYVVPEEYYHPLRRRFRVLSCERRIYEAIGITKWKDKIPETGGMLVGFSKGKLSSFRDPEYLFKFGQETCYAEAMHLWSIPAGFCILLLCPRELILSVALPVASVNAVLQLLPILVQRYVRPQIMRLYSRCMNQIQK